MNRFRSGLVPLFAVAALLSCSSEPTGDLRGDPSAIVATPSQLFIELGQTKLVKVGAVDAQGNPLDFNYEVSSAGSGISVRRDSSYLPIFIDDSTLQAPATGPTFQFIVEGDAYTQTSFTVSAGGLDVVVPVQVVPQSGLAATFSNAAPALGEVVTLTAPSGITFNLDATLDIGGNPVTIVSQDATNIAFIPPPSVNSPVTVNGVVSAAAPDVVFSPATDTPLVTPLIDTVDVTYSTTAPTLGQSVTLTSPNPLIQLVVDSLIFPGQLPGREGDAQNIVVAVDSQSLTFDAPPNIDGSGTVVNFHFPGDYLIPLPTRPTVTGQNIGLFLAATISDLNPDVSETVTITAPAGFTFDPAAAVQVGASAAIVVANNGASLGIVPLPGSAGVPQVDGVVPTAAPSNILTMPAGEDVVTVPATVPTLAGSDAPGTAPSLTTPALGEASVLFDVPDYENGAACDFGTVCRYYQLTVTQAGTYDINLDWNVGGDIDVYLCPAPGNIDVNTCDFQAATGNHPEFGSYVLAPGNYWIIADDFGGDAAGTTLVITVNHNP